LSSMTRYRLALFKRVVWRWEDRLLMSDLKLPISPKT
jgi:hypothetical protein